MGWSRRETATGHQAVIRTVPGGGGGEKEETSFWPPASVEMQPGGALGTDSVPLCCTRSDECIPTAAPARLFILYLVFFLLSPCLKITVGEFIRLLRSVDIHKGNTEGNSLPLLKTPAFVP